jgi:hypothetical protein
MKLKTLFIILLTILIVKSGYSQEKKLKFLYIEGGADFISGEPPEKGYIRADVNQYSVDYVTTTLRGLLHKSYIGAKGELRILNGKVGLLSGLHYTRMVSSIGKEAYWSENPDYFYLLLRQEETKTDYLKVREINQVTGYIGIPLELRIYPYKPRGITVYYKVGSDFNLRLHSATKAVYYDKTMDQFDDKIGDVVEDPWTFYSSFHLGVGFRIGKDEKPGVNLEVLVPVAIMAGHKSGLVNPEAGGGFQINVRLPF